jgi:hypothetical protein
LPSLNVERKKLVTSATVFKEDQIVQNKYLKGHVERKNCLK